VAEFQTSTCGWNSLFPTFHETKPRVVRLSLQQFVQDASPEQLRAWDDSIPMLQRETGKILEERKGAQKYTAILEYRLPLESRRPDVVMLTEGAVVVLELKGKSHPSQADIDQVSAYARDLRAYHKECQNVPVFPVLVPTRAKDHCSYQDGVSIVSPNALENTINSFVKENEKLIDPHKFLENSAYSPLPTLVQAARDLFHSGEVREIWRARALTDPAVNRISEVAHQATSTKTRHLILITGVPGAGKTLVGLRAVHAGYLDDLAVERGGGKPTTPALFLSGNGPLVEVLQYELKKSGGGGKTFVRHVKDYLNSYVPKTASIPNEHLLVFDEAQRAFSKEKVADLHKNWPVGIAESEPHHFIELCERMPEWSVMVGLIGEGQEIHLGEEEGLIQWRNALEASNNSDDWTVHAPATSTIEEAFDNTTIAMSWDDSLNLDTEIRYHLASDLHKYVDKILEGNKEEASPFAIKLWKEGMRFWLTRDLDVAKNYLQERYSEYKEARFGMVASSRDKILIDYGVNNDFQSTKRVKLGPWYSENQNEPHSCRRLETVVTEFGSQGLELDMTLLCWGNDLIIKGGEWSNEYARGYRPSVPLRDPFRLRQNAYRVLLTRGRDGVVTFLPRDSLLDETWGFLIDCGFKEL